MTDVPPELVGRGIAPASEAHGFSISLDAAEPWGGGRTEGRVEAKGGRHGEHPVVVCVTCSAAWLDLPPQLAGQRKLFRLETIWSMRARSVAIWLEEEIWLARWEIGDLSEANWLHFRFNLPPGLPRAFEGRFVAFRWRVEAERRRTVGYDRASIPLLLEERRTVPVVRVETSSMGSWRLSEWRSEEEADGVGGPCTVRYEERRPEHPASGQDAGDITRSRR